MTTPNLSRRGFGRLALVTGVAGATVAATSPRAEAVGTTFRAATLNILHTLSHADFMTDLRNVAGRAELIGLNEVAPRRESLVNWASANGWHLWMPAGAYAGADPLLARRDRFTVLDRGSVFACDTAGPGVEPPARYINWVQYQERTTGRNVIHVHTHLNSHIDDNGHPYDLPRTRDAEIHIAKIKNLVLDKKDHGQVIVTGDFNVDYVDDKRVQYAKFPYTVLEERQAAGAIPGLRSNYSLQGVTGLPTHGTRRIDYVYEWVRVPEARVMRMDNAYVFNDTKSDHNGVVARFALDA